MATIDSINGGLQVEQLQDPPEPAPQQRFVLKMRGLPWEAQDSDVINFFSDEKIKAMEIIRLPSGSTSGEALVEFNTAKAYKSAMAKNNKHIKQRYIELMPSNGDELDTVIKRQAKIKQEMANINTSNNDIGNNGGIVNASNCSQFVVRMRGVPFQATKTDVIAFFGDAALPSKVHILRNELGRPIGEAFAEFSSSEQLELAMKKDCEHIGSRYIELYRTTPDEVTYQMRRQEFGGRGGMRGRGGRGRGRGRGRNISPMETHTKYMVMRGIPFSCTESEVRAFFAPSGVNPISITLEKGKGYVEFFSIMDANIALSRNHDYIGTRYIELFPIEFQEFNEHTDDTFASQRRFRPEPTPYGFSAPPAAYGDYNSWGGGFGGAAAATNPRFAASYGPATSLMDDTIPMTNSYAPY